MIRTPTNHDYLLQTRKRLEARWAGAHLVSPENVWFSADTVIGARVTIEPFVTFGPGVRVADGAVISSGCTIVATEIGAKVTVGPGCTIAGCKIAPGATIGPNAHLRPETIIGADARIGCAEIKNSRLGKGVKVPHWAYVGDADIGAYVNVGAGVVFCNYNGHAKHRTTIGDYAKIGAGCELIAPLTIGAGAIIAAGSVVDKDVEPDALAIARAPLKIKPGGAIRFRARRRGEEKP